MIDTKKQADNGFGGGLVMDTHPINADNNTLSNCLNGTLITYNGNEMMLQNDMGNGRVETAYLPPGYVPIGMKEHGGIIYVASYNPLTNHGQLGSFPSPERNITSLEKGSPSLQISTDTFGFKASSGVNTLYTKLQLLDKSTIRPGDKFSLSFSSTASNLKDLITAYDNAGVNKILTLKVCVRDNNGNLTDITESLKTFDNDYFMYKSSSQAFSDYSVDDMRKAVDNDKFNIYSGKLSGELYLVAELATIKDYEIALSGGDVIDDKRILTFVNRFKQDIPGIYKGTYVQLNSDKGESVNGFVPYSGSDNTQNVEVKEVSSGGKLTYSLTPVLTYARLNSMTKTGTIDMSLFGTGEIKLQEWRYYNDLTNNTLHINWGMEAYLRNDALSHESITEVTFHFWKFENNNFQLANSITTKARKNYTGNFSETFTYEEVPHGNLYIVQIEVQINYNNSPRTEYFYKILYTSEYFNQFYSDGTTTNFMEKTIDLEVKSDAVLEKTQEYVTKGAVKNSPTYSMLNKPSWEYYESKPFYYIQDQLTGEEYDLNIKNYLSYESFDPENESWDLPFILNQKSVKSEVTIEDSKVVMDDVVVQGTFLKEKFTNGKEITDELSDNKVSFSSTIEDGKLSLKLNTVSEYIAEDVAQQVNASSTSGFRGYMVDENLQSIFGYNPVEENMYQPKYGLTMKVGRNDRKGRLNAGICEFTGSSYTASAKGTVIETLQTYRTWRQWKNEICPAMVNALQNSLHTSPNVFFIIGGDTDKWSSGSHGNSNLKSRTSGATYTEDYNIVLWRGYNEDQTYYFLNEYFTKTSSGSDEQPSNGLAALRSIFKHIYTKQEFINSGTMFKSGNYSYTQNYTINYSGTLTTTHTEVENENKLSVNEVETFNIQGALDTLSTYLGEHLSADQLQELKDSNNFKITVTLPEKSTQDLSLSAESPTIDDVVIRYVEAAGQMVEGALSGTNGELIEFDCNGNPFSDTEMYYIGSDGKAYPLSNPVGLPGSALSRAGVTTTTLNQIYKGFRVQYDQATKMYQLRVNPSGVSSYTLKTEDYPRISSDNRPFYPAHADHGQGCLLNITLTGGGKILR